MLNGKQKTLHPSVGRIRIYKPSVKELTFKYILEPSCIGAGSQTVRPRKAQGFADWVMSRRYLSLTLESISDAARSPDSIAPFIYPCQIAVCSPAKCRHATRLRNSDRTLVICPDAK